MTITINDSAITTRIASLDELQLLLLWAGDEGWNPGLDDAPLFHSTDADGFLVSTINEHLVAGISLVKHTSDQAFLGLYICAPESRGKGIGMAIWDEALTLVDGHTIGLDGVADQQENYRKSGFIYHFGNRRYSGELAIPDDHISLILNNAAVSVSKATSDDSDAVIAYDASIGGFERINFFHAWLKLCRSRSTFVARKGGLIVGVIGVRRCQDGYKVGPWLADSQFIATKLLHAVSHVTKNETVMIDIPDINEAAIEIAEALALQPMFDTARMYKGVAPEIDERRLFGVATLELG
ncbi:MAG: GNAT family N-acetyltransferase [Granulosicoccus sp.]